SLSSVTKTTPLTAKQDPQYLIVEGLIADQAAARVDGLAAGQVGITAASLLNYDFHRRQIPDLHAHLQHRLGLVLKYISESEIVTIARLPVSCRNQPGEAVPVAVLEDAVESAEIELRAGELPERRGLDALTVLVGTSPFLCPIRVAHRRGMNDAEHNLSILLQREQRRENRHSAGVIVGTIDRIDNPLAPVAAGATARLCTGGFALLFAENRIIRKGGGNSLPDHSLALFVGRCYGTVVRLHLRPNTLSQMIHGNFAGLVADIQRPCEFPTLGWFSNFD